jgi:hypothetical protein
MSWALLLARMSADSGKGSSHAAPWDVYWVILLAAGICLACSAALAIAARVVARRDRMANRPPSLRNQSLRSKLSFLAWMLLAATVLLVVIALARDGTNPIKDLWVTCR